MIMQSTCRILQIAPIVTKTGVECWDDEMEGLNWARRTEFGEEKKNLVHITTQHIWSQEIPSKFPLLLAVFTLEKLVLI